jgi:hypothetical protein
MDQTIETYVDQINSVCKNNKEYKEYSCKKISWNDNTRFTNNGNLSSVGPNITDTRLVTESGKSLYTIRPDNWNEKLGTVSSDSVALIVKNLNTGILSPITLKEYLQNITKYNDTITTDSLSSQLDTKVSIRFQVTFLPISNETLQFCPESFNYNTHSESDPRNLLLLATTQGTSLCQDKPSYQKLFQLTNVGNDKVSKNWFEAEKTDFKVGTQQIETNEQRSESIKKGKAIASVIGIRSMGQRFNALMTIQIPIEQKEVPKSRGMVCGYNGGYKGGYNSGDMVFETCSLASDAELESYTFGGVQLQSYSCDGPTRGCNSCTDKEFDNLIDSLKQKTKGKGISNAARINKGSVYETVSKSEILRVKNPNRDSNQHITITVVLYNTTQNGIPTTKDVISAIEELEQLYRSCDSSGKLDQSSLNYMTVESNTDVHNYNVFPNRF